MTMGKGVRQREIRWVYLEPTEGAEKSKKRPYVVLQSTIVNHYSKTLIVAPIMPGHKDWPFVVNIKPSAMNALDKDGHINLKQLRAVDVSRVSNCHGVIERIYTQQIKEALGVVFDF